MAFPVVFLVVVALAIAELRSEGAPGANRLPMANRLAQAQADGTVAPRFRLPTPDGEGTIDIQDFAGRSVVLNFWASWCAPCREEAPHLQGAWQEYRGRGIQFIGVNHKDERSAALAFQRETGVTYPSGFDPAGRVATRYSLVGIPTTLVIRDDGVIAYRFLGKVDAGTLRAALDRVLGGDSA